MADLGQAIRDTFAKAEGNTVDPNLVSAKAPKGKAEVLTFEQKLEQDIGIYFPNDKQALAVLEFCELGIEAEAQDGSMRRRMMLVIHENFPNGITYNQSKVIGRATQAVSQYVYRQFVLAVRLMTKHGAKYDKQGNLLQYGNMPKKGGGSKSGTRAVSPSTWQTNHAKMCKALRAHIAGIPKKDIEPATLKEVTVTLKALDAVLSRAVRVKVA
jgi:hypothetical protein